MDWSCGRRPAATRSLAPTTPSARLTASAASLWRTARRSTRGGRPAGYRARCVRVAEQADGRAANPFESVLRAIALDVPGLQVEPQIWIEPIGRPDVVDVRRRVVIEADSFEFHGRRKALVAD